MSNNPDNNNIVSDSSDLVSEESVGNYYTNQLSNEAVSGLSQGTDESNGAENDNDDSLQGSEGSDGTGGDEASSNENTVNSTSLTISSTKIKAGTPVTVTLKDENGKGLSGKKILFTVKNKVYTKNTNSNGQAKLTFSNVGTYKLSVSFEGDSTYESSKLSSTVTVSKASTSLSVSNSTVPRSTSLYVTLKNKETGAALSGKTVIFVIPERKNETYKKVTNSKGQAKLVINSKKNFAVKISFAGDKNFLKSSTKTTVKPIKCKTKVICPSGTAEFGSNFVVTIRKKVNNGLVKNEKVIIKIANKNKSFTRTTNSKGQVSIPISYMGNLKFKVSFPSHDSFSTSSASTNISVVKGATTLTGPGTVGQGFNYVLTLKNSAGKVLANKKVKITFNKKTFTKTTNSKGQISLKMDYKKGSYPIVASYSGDKNYNSSKLSKTIKIDDPSFSISKIISAAKDLKTRVEYINLLNKSYTVTIDGKKLTMDEFAYLMAGAITNINSGSKANVKFKDLSNNYKSSGAKINGKLSKKEYLKLATNITKYVNSNKCIPTNRPTNLGKMEANLYIYSLTTVLSSYSKNKKLPSSVSVKTKNVRGGYSYSISQGGKLLNCREIYDSEAFAKYLKTGGKSALNDAIKKKAKELTKGLKSPLAKAIAIFRFVRDDVTYSFYSNSRKGATGTFKSKSGNCCDKANLIVAMCRSVGVHARYSHAQGCKFQSGLYTGHVWAQVYDTSSQTWYSADATSFRNEVGSIKNWNTKSHYRDHNYVQIPF